MLKVRVIPTLLWKDFGLVKGVNFDHGRRVGSVQPAIRVYNSRDVDELILLDVTASINSQLIDIESIEEFSKDCFVPFTVGGGVRKIDDFHHLLNAGADKVSLNSGAYLRPDLINEAANKFGSQCVVVSVDVRKEDCGNYVCYSNSGLKNTGKSMPDWLKELENRGAGEILLNAIHRDGTMSGYDLEMLERAVGCVNIPIILSGGAGKYDHLVEAISVGASAVSASSMFHFTEQTPSGCKSYLAKFGIPVRIKK
jgi:cyclase